MSLAQFPNTEFQLCDTRFGSATLQKFKFAIWLPLGQQSANKPANAATATQSFLALIANTKDALSILAKLPARMTKPAVRPLQLFKSLTGETAEEPKALGETGNANPSGTQPFS
jgi:hypothetical protein